VKVWLNRLCILALCVTLSLACVVSKTEQCLYLLSAFQSEGQPSSKRPPRFIMTVQDREPQISALEIAVLPCLVEPIVRTSATTVVSEFTPYPVATVLSEGTKQSRGPPLS